MFRNFECHFLPSHSQVFLWVVAQKFSSSAQLKFFFSRGAKQMIKEVEVNKIFYTLFFSLLFFSSLASLAWVENRFLSRFGILSNSKSTLLVSLFASCFVLVVVMHTQRANLWTRNVFFFSSIWSDQWRGDFFIILGIWEQQQLLVHSSLMCRSHLTYLTKWRGTSRWSCC